jgi:Amt family ammonium transporter
MTSSGNRLSRLLKGYRTQSAGLACGLLGFLLLPGMALAAENSDVWPPNSSSFLATLALCLLVPLGLTLMAIGGSKEERAPDVAVAALAAVALSLFGYLFSGFALQFGGVGLVSHLPGLETFQWSPWDITRSAGWGILGLRGFMLADPAMDTRVYAFFFVQWLPVVVCTLVPLAALAGKVPNYVLLLCAFLVSAVIYPIFGNWLWGGGWLANLGQTQRLGHGVVDFAGMTGTFALGAGVAIAALFAFRLYRPRTGGSAKLPPAHFPLFMIAGAFLVLIGWSALALSNPLALAEDIHPITVVGNFLFAAAGGIILPLLYTWFVAGKPDAWMMARGLVAGLVAAGASAAFVPNWAACLIGALAGLLLPFVTYLTDHVLCLDDDLAVVGAFLLPALWGLLAVGLFASGRWGIGWNRIGASSYLGVLEQGVTGLWPAPGFQADWPGQFQAQLAGAGAALLLSTLFPFLLFRGLAYLHWQSDSWKKEHPAPLTEPAQPNCNTPAETPLTETESTEAPSKTDQIMPS